MPTTQTKPTPSNRLQTLLKWAAEDLSDPVICSNPERLQQERQVVLTRLTPHIDEIVQLAWRQLQLDQMSSPNRSGALHVTNAAALTGIAA